MPKLAILLLVALSLIAATHAIKSSLINSTLAAPVKVIYIDWRNINWNNPELTVLEAVDAGFNLVILAFYLSGSGSADMAKAWEGVPSNVKQQTMQQVHSKGASVIVSLGGSTDSPYDISPTLLGGQVAQWARNHFLDGVDFDLENLNVGFRGGPMSDTATVKWIADVTNAARSTLGSGGIITHAPQAPYFGPIGSTNTWTGPTGGFTSVYQQAPSINFFLVQFYNQGATCYVDYSGLFTTSCGVFPSTALGQINQAGVPLTKLVVGKYVTPADASNGWVSPADLNRFFATARSQLGWDTGVMGWQWQETAVCANWIKTIYP